jgi:hypothetical protein
MTKTKIDYFGVLILIIGTVCSTGLLIWMTYEWISEEKSIDMLQKIFFTALSGILTPLIWTIEIPKVKSVEIAADRLVIQNLFTRTKKEIPFDLVDGLKTASNWTRGGRVYEIIIVVRGKSFHKISTNYIKNYDKIRTELTKRFTVLHADDLENIRSVIKDKVRE